MIFSQESHKTIKNIFSMVLGTIGTCCSIRQVENHCPESSCFWSPNNQATTRGVVKQANDAGGEGDRK